MADVISFPDLAAAVRALPPSCGPVRVVAVDGPAGSGKTTFAGRLASALGCRVVHGDDFPVPWDEPPQAWFEQVEDRVLGPLSAGAPGGYRRYDWKRGAFAEWVEVPVAPVLVLEGVSTARRGAPTAFAVWVEAPRRLRLARVLARDGAALEPRWHAWMRAEDEWFAADETRSRAGLLVDGAAVPGEFAVL
ncbi:uridine kinase family protein [Planobispora takensis]|uniref:uridine kinase family protein n=1 Tax=Planobispora takensis TaxID=1367882 RepID=UPI0019436E1A|nr:(d)CMP kinase [Planobispora takensis]